MSGYTLTYRTTRTPALFDGAALRPDTLGSLDRDAVAAVALRLGRRELRLDEVFDIDGEAGERLTLRNAPPLDRLGAGMRGGELFVEGDAGDDLGASMTGGLLHVRGGAGDRVGGPDRGAAKGMTGGEILIDGNAGDYVGLRLRRGLIAVGGKTGKSPGYRMLAGTIVLMRTPGEAVGLEMRRGTILCLAPANNSASSQWRALDGAFTSVGELDLATVPGLRLVLTRLRELDWPMDDDVSRARFRGWSGDRSEFDPGRGELWLRAC